MVFAAPLIYRTRGRSRAYPKMGTCAIAGKIDHLSVKLFSMTQSVTNPALCRD